MVDAEPLGPEPDVSPDVPAAFEATLTRRLIAEFVGTLLFVAVGAGAATVFATGPLQRFGALPEAFRTAPGNQEIFGGLFANSLGDVLGVALAFAGILAVLVYAIGGISGAHVNPAVTFALAVGRRFRWNEVVPYWLAQVLGGIAGAIVVAALYRDFFGEARVNVDQVLYGATFVSQGVEVWSAILAEAFIAYILMTAIMAVAVDPRAPKGWSGLVIGLALMAGILVTAFITGGSANFARSLGPFVASALFDATNIPWADLYVYAAGPIIGAAAAALVYESVTGLERVAPPPRPGAATPTDVTEGREPNLENLEASSGVEQPPPDEEPPSMRP